MEFRVRIAPGLSQEATKLGGEIEVLRHISSKGPNFAAFKNVSNGVVSFELSTYSIMIGGGVYRWGGKGGWGENIVHVSLITVSLFFYRSAAMFRSYFLFFLMQ